MIELREVCKSYSLLDGKRLPILQGVSVRINPGDFVGIMSPSGAGKSTLLNIIGCLDRFDSGVYELGGRRVDLLPDNDLAQIRNQKIGFVFQSFHLLSRLTAVENVALPLLYSRGKLLNRDPGSLLDLVGLKNRAGHFPGQMSGGEQQRVAIARALVNDPKIILADEPTGNLDENNGMEVMKILERLNRKGKTIVMVTHDDTVAGYAKRILRLNNGGLVEG